MGQPGLWPRSVRGRHRLLQGQGIDFIAEPYNEGETDYNAIISRFKNAGADLIVHLGFYTEAALQRRQANQQGLDVPFFAGAGVISSEFIRLGGEDVEGVLVLDFMKEEMATTQLRGCRSGVKAKFDEGFNLYHRNGYDVMNFVIRGLEAATGDSREDVNMALRTVSFAASTSTSSSTKRATWWCRRRSSAISTTSRSSRAASSRTTRPKRPEIRADRGPVAVPATGPSCFESGFFARPSMATSSSSCSRSPTASLGSVYALLAIGFSMIYGILRMMNFAHGDLYAFSSILIAAMIADVYPIWIALPTGVAVGAVIGVLIERVCYRPLRFVDRSVAIVSSLGAAFVLRNASELFFGVRPSPSRCCWPAPASTSPGSIFPSPASSRCWWRWAASPCSPLFLRRSKLGTGISTSPRTSRPPA